MATAIKNMPDHWFNIHDWCDGWCNYKMNPETYVHKAIGKGFID